MSSINTVYLLRAMMQSDSHHILVRGKFTGDTVLSTFDAEAAKLVVTWSTPTNIVYKAKCLNVSEPTLESEDNT